MFSCKLTREDARQWCDSDLRKQIQDTICEALEACGLSQAPEYVAYQDSKALSIRTKTCEITTPSGYILRHIATAPHDPRNGFADPLEDWVGSSFEAQEARLLRTAVAHGWDVTWPYDQSGELIPGTFRWHS